MQAFSVGILSPMSHRNFLQERLHARPFSAPEIVSALQISSSIADP
jgi:hypothetical protein